MIGPNGRNPDSICPAQKSVAKKIPQKLVKKIWKKCEWELMFQYKTQR
jgi:hypothetical protein